MPVSVVALRSAAVAARDPALAIRQLRVRRRTAVHPHRGECRCISSRENDFFSNNCEHEQRGERSHVDAVSKTQNTVAV